MIEIVVNVLFRLLLIGSFARRLLMLFGIHLWMIIIVVMIAMHIVRIVMMMSPSSSSNSSSRMHARRPCIAAMHHGIAAARACTHHIAIRQKDIDEEDEHE